MHGDTYLSQGGTYLGWGGVPTYTPPRLNLAGVPTGCELTNKVKLLLSLILWMRAAMKKFWAKGASLDPPLVCTRPRVRFLVDSYI